MTKKTSKKSQAKSKGGKVESVEISDLITIAQAAEMRGCTKASLHDLIYRGRLNAFDIAGRKFVRRSDVENWQTSRPGKKPGPKPGN